MPQTRTSLHNLKLAYITAFILIALVILSSLFVNQIALYREGVARSVAALESRQSVHSQRIGQNSLFVLVPAHKALALVQLQSDIAGIQADRSLFIAQYTGYYPQFANLDGGHGRAPLVYMMVLHAAQDEVRIETESAVLQKRDAKQLNKDIITIFYTEPEQLRNIQAAQAIIDSDIDGYALYVRNIDIGSTIFGLLVLTFEGLFVLRPALRYFDRDIKQATVSPERLSIVPQEDVLA